MSNHEIVEKLASERFVEKIINNITNGQSPDPTALDDLAQDLYLSFLLDAKLPTIYDEGHINFYVTRCVMNNIMSSSSPYYRIYLKPRALSVELDERIKNKNGEG